MFFLSQLDCFGQWVIANNISSLWFGRPDSIGFELIEFTFPNLFLSLSVTLQPWWPLVTHVIFLKRLILIEDYICRIGVVLLSQYHWTWFIHHSLVSLGRLSLFLQLKYFFITLAVEFYWANIF